MAQNRDSENAEPQTLRKSDGDADKRVSPRNHGPDAMS